ncbi:hypothetical protein [Cytobacillus oceanisediminis]|uniref:Uncharacterized protein n=1 Tax=Cytobacillus oceanisediminis TaxID=665099 RepID=A0ABX3CL08_9BACI|nr:hypothetical protein [Cytobacillus oceanisediminis]OHX42357.1 hypothetical protein BBV17_27555 [Cytobacillus oceanisediminis]
MRRYFRLYYKRWDGNIGAGLEEYVPGVYPSELKMFASVFIKQNTSDYDLICKLIDSYCPTEGPIKLFTTQLVDRYTLDHLRTRYPNIVFRRTRGSQIKGVRDFADDALRRRSTIIEKGEI